LGTFSVYPGDNPTSEAFAINSAGTAVGYLYAGRLGGVDTYRPVRWDAGGTAATELGNLGTDNNGTTFGRADAINDNGTAIGYMAKYIGPSYRGYRAVRWNASGTAAIELDKLEPQDDHITSCFAYAINGAGTAVGSADKYNAGTILNSRAARWDGSGTAITELGNLGTNNAGVTSCAARAINAGGTAVGSANKYVGGLYRGNRAVRWDASGTAATELTNLGTDSSGSANGAAYGINADGNAVGTEEKYVGGTPFGNRAVLWDRNAGVFDLNTLIDPASGWTLTEADGISDGNWVVGSGSFDPDGSGPLSAYNRAFLLNVSSVVPDPGSVCLLTVSGLAMLRRRQRAREMWGRGFRRVTCV
jgi:hypothetical protein